MKSFKVLARFIVEAVGILRGRHLGDLAAARHQKLLRRLVNTDVGTLDRSLFENDRMRQLLREFALVEAREQRGLFTSILWVSTITAAIAFLHLLLPGRRDAPFQWLALGGLLSGLTLGSAALLHPHRGPFVAPVARFKPWVLLMVSTGAIPTVWLLLREPVNPESKILNLVTFVGAVLAGYPLVALVDGIRLQQSWRRHCARRVEALIVGNLLKCLAVLQGRRSWLSTRRRREAIRHLALAASAAERGLSSTASSLPHTWRASARQQGVRVATSLRSLTLWFLTPGPTTRHDLHERIVRLISRVLTSDWKALADGIECSSLAGHDQRRWPTVWRLVVVSIPLALLALAWSMWPDFRGSEARVWLTLAVAIWSLAHILVLLDSEIGQRGQSAGSIMSAFSSLGRGEK